MPSLFDAIFKTPKPVIGMVHLAPLPGAPRFEGDLDAVVERALKDADALQRGGVDALLVENYGDAPFFPDAVGPETVAAMTRAVGEIRKGRDLPVGVNVLRNDARSALAVAAACGCAFIRVNVHCGARATDQGILTGEAAETLRYRKSIGAESVAIFADVAVKHSAPVGERPLEEETMETIERGLADAVIFTGPATGAPPLRRDVERVRKRVGSGARILIGSGVAPDSAATFLSLADGLIVGSHFKEGGRVESPVSGERVAEFMAAVRAAREP